jgi:glycosyltransferase involved in cell wall biosynthesis
MKILVTGLPYFGKKLVNELREFDRENKWLFFDTYYSKMDRIRFIFHLLTADRVVSINGVSSKSGSLDWVISLKKKLVLQWQGSDVSIAVQNYRSGKFNRKYVDYGVSFTDAEWLKKELSAIDVRAGILPFKHLAVTDRSAPFRTTDVLSYIAQDNEKFYGIEQIEALATNFPSVNFHIVGSNGQALKSPANVIYHGWVQQDKMKALLNEHAIFLRLTAHDGYSLAVMEAIANGNYVIWNNPHPVAIDASGQNYQQLFGDLLKHITDNALSRNRLAMQWAKENLDRELILDRYSKTITGV